MTYVPDTTCRSTACRDPTQQQLRHTRVGNSCIPHATIYRVGCCRIPGTDSEQFGRILVTAKTLTIYEDTWDLFVAALPFLLTSGVGGCTSTSAVLDCQHCSPQLLPLFHCQFKCHIHTASFRRTLTSLIIGSSNGNLQG